MTLQVQPLLASVEGAPGDEVRVPVRLVNCGTSAATCRIGVVGLDPSAQEHSTETIVVPAGATVDHVMVTSVPASLGVGRHAAAIEITSDRPGDRPLLAPFALSIASVAHVAMASHPSTIRGRRRASLRLDVVNNEPAPVDLTLSGAAPGVRVRFRNDRVHLPPEGRAVVPGKVKGPRHGSGEPTQHNVVITATGRASSTTITTPYIQRPVFAHRARMLVAAFTVIALWLGAIGVVALWWANREDKAADGTGAVISRDSDGDGIPDTFLHADGKVYTGSDTDGDGIPDVFEDESGAVIRFVDSDDDGAPDTFQDATGKQVQDPTGGAASSAQPVTETADSAQPTGPTSVVVRGTVKADGDPSDIMITLCAIRLGEMRCRQSGISGFAGARPPDASKIWPARHGLSTVGTLDPVRQTEPIRPSTTTPKADGVWQFPDVALRQTYQLEFAKSGFQTQSFVVTPPEDGSAVVLDVEMQAADGEIAGVVRDSASGAPLGGAAITVTDGTVTFTTTTATVGEVGTWSVTGVSTPGDYTVLAAKRGYGTEVMQAHLDAGGKLDNADLTMVAGVGSLSGRVTGRDGPLGGATVTVTNGESSSTTTTLTTGNIGFYSVPQLEFGTYTVLVEAPDYVAQTARVRVDGAVRRDFGLSRTTVRLTGIVTSDRTGAGIPNAGLTLTTGDLKFKAVTAIAPNQGSFAIDNLPPGNYTITVEHYQHVTSTQLITLTAGITPPPIHIVLERTDGLPDIGSGSLVVEVVDPTGETSSERQIRNATVQLIRTQTGEARAPVTQEAFDFRLDRIPIGTYTLLVTAPRYNPAPPRQVSIGLSEQRVEVQMLRLGQASGRVVDSLTKQPLSDYFVSLFRQPENPGDAPVFTLAAAASGLWQTPPDTLIPGTYRIEISDAASPAGYLVRNDQLLDTAVVGVGDARLMRFVLPENNRDPITVADIEADPYPTISGRIYRPTLTGSDVGYQPLDRNELAVTMSCPGGTPLAATVSDAAGVRGATPPLFDSFTITPTQIDAGNLVGDCTLAVRAGSDFAPRDVALTGVDASDGVTSVDRRLHIAVAPPAPAIGGSVFWLDGGTRVPIRGATVSATPIVRFDTVESASASADPDAVPVPAETTSDSEGIWDLDGQLWGVFDYLFAADDFAPGTVSIMVDDTGASAAAGVATTVDETSAGRFEIELSAPNPRTVTGTVTIKSTDGSFAFDDIDITAVSPTGQTVTETQTPTPGVPAILRGTPSGGVLPFQIVNALPGTWSVDVSQPDNHDEFGPQPVADLVPPGSAPFPGFDLALVELATLRLTLEDVNHSDVTVVPHIRLVPDPGVPGIPTIDKAMVAVGLSEPNTFVTDGIEVDPSDPIANFLRYTLEVTVPGYDTTRALVDGSAVAGGATALDVAFRAGSTTSLTLTLPKQGSFEGDVVGVVNGDIPEDPQEIPITSGNVAVTPVHSDGTALTAAELEDVDFTLTVSGNSFDISGTQGYYRILVTHGEFTPRTPPGDGFTPDVLDPLASTVESVFRIVNDRVNQPADFVMDIIKGGLDISVFESLTKDPPVEVQLAVYTLKQGTTEVTGTVLNDTVELVALFPGEYTLEIRKFDSVLTTEEIAFPVITRVVIERAVAGVPTTTVVRAPLPALQPSVSGSILGQNQNGDAVELPGSGVTYVVTSTYDEPAIEINGTTTVPDPNAGNATAQINLAGASAGTVEYTFRNMPIGVHHVTLAGSTQTALLAKGYTLLPPGSGDTVVDGSGVMQGPDFTFRVPNVTLTAQLTSGDYPGLTNLTNLLTAPSGRTYVGQFDETNDRLTFTQVAPETGKFLLDFNDALHLPVDNFELEVHPDTDGEPRTASALVPTTATLGRVTGSASQRDTAASTTPLGGGATITLTGGGKSFTFTVPTGGSASTWQLDVPPATYQLVTARLGYTTQTQNNVVVTAGTVRPNTNVQVEKLATLTVTLSNGTSVTSPVVTLRPPSGPLIAGAAGTAGGQPTATFTVPVGTYTIVVSADDYRQTDITPTVNLGIGVVATRSVALARLLSVSVAGPGTATVKVFDNDADTTPITVGPKTTTTSFEFSAGLPASGDVRVQVEATGYRTQRVTAAFALDQSLSVVMLPNVTVTGVITNPSGTVLTGNKVAGGITATSDATTLTGQVDTNGNYTIAGVGVGPTGQNRVWTINYDRNGVGASSGTDTITITGASANQITGPSIKVTPRTVKVTFTVRSDVSGTPPIVGALVTVGSLPAVPTVTGGTVSVNVPENSTNLAWAVSATDHVTKNGTIIEFPNRNDFSVPVTLVSRARTLTVREKDTDVGIDAATVTICPADTADVTVCAVAATSIGTTTTASAGPPTVAGGLLEFLSPLAEGSYRIIATKSAVIGAVTYTVSGTGLGGPNPLIEIDLP